MLKPSLQDIVFRKTIPHPKQNDPNSFYTHVQRNLVPEVRLEVQTFYGSLDCIEAQYPGLDYTFTPHRKRLARYPWHRRLFRTFDELRLTESEILSLCQWEGTRSAKERYEAETKRTIRDTTADEVVAAPQGHGPRARIYWTESTKPSQETQSISPAVPDRKEEWSQECDVQYRDNMPELADSSQPRAEQPRDSTPQQWITHQHQMETQWEQWMKEAMERNELDRDSLLAAIREGQTVTMETTESTTYPQSISTETGSSNNPSASLVLTQPQIAQRYEDLRTMLQDLQSANNHLSAENAALAMFLNRNQPETAR